MTTSDLATDLDHARKLREVRPIPEWMLDEAKRQYATDETSIAEFERIADLYVKGERLRP